MKLNEAECILKIKERAKESLEETGMVTVISIDTKLKGSSPSGRRISPDLVITVRTKDKSQYRLYFEVKAIGQPRYARMAVNQLQDLVSREKRAYGIFGAPYLSEDSIRICRENDIGCIDLAGN